MCERVVCVCVRVVCVCERVVYVCVRGWCVCVSGEFLANLIVGCFSGFYYELILLPNAILIPSW